MTWRTAVGRGLFLSRAALAAIAIAPLQMSTAAAQVWLPYQGEGSVAVSYQFFTGGDHLFSSDALDGESSRGYVAEGDRWFLGDTYSHTVTTAVDYGLTDRWALTGSLSYARAMYDGRAPVHTNDDGQYHGSLQDLHLKVRYLVTESPALFVLGVAALLPTQDYEARGHSALGRGLRELQFSMQASRSFAPLLPRAYAQAGYLHGIAERAKNDISPVRGSLDLEIGYVVTPRFVVRGLSIVHRTYNGKDWITRTDTGEVGAHATGSTAFSAQASDADYVRLGGGIGVQVNSKVGWYLVAVSTVDGKNVDDANIVVSGFSWKFRTPLSYDW